MKYFTNLNILEIYFLVRGRKPKIKIDAKIYINE